MLNQQARLDIVFHALSDPTRRGMVDRLIRGSASVSELAAPLDMSLSAVVQHLQVLEESGLVRSDKAGRVRTCRIEPTALRTVEHWIAERRTSWERHFDRLGEFLASEERLARGAENTEKRLARGAENTEERLARGAENTEERLARGPDNDHSNKNLKRE